MVKVFTKCCITKELCVIEIINEVPGNFIIECINSSPLGKIEVNSISEPHLFVFAYVEVNKHLH